MKPETEYKIMQFATLAWLVAAGGFLGYVVCRAVGCA